jgi:hypothetical protein
LSVPEPEEEEQKTKHKEKGKRKHQSHVAEEEESPPSKKALVEIKDFMYFKLKIVDLKKDSKWWSPWRLPTQKIRIQSILTKTFKDMYFIEDS